MSIPRWTVVLALLTLAIAAPAEATLSRSVEFPLRAKKLNLEIYYPVRQPLGTIIMGSGDVGWTGLSQNMAEFMSDHGWLVIGVNVRQYLTAFRDGRTKHLTTQDVPADFKAMADFLDTQHLLFQPVVMSGVSEGAALAVLVAASDKNHSWIRGLVTMGIPAKAELAWKWSDFTTWITKSDADEPSFAPFDFIGAVAPVPVVMIQSKKDEYVPEADYQQCHANAKDPKKLVLIDASNHRFTDRRTRLQQEYLSALTWILEPTSR